MTYESLKDLPNDTYITIEVNGNKTRYDIENITPEFWQFINEVATSIETTIVTTN